MSQMATNGEFSVGNRRFGFYVLLFVLGVVVLWLTLHPKSPLRPHYELAILFPEVGSLRAGDLIQVLGIPHGYVRAIKLREDGVLVYALVDRDVRIARDSRFRVINTGLLGKREVEIRLGHSGEFYQDDDSLHGGYDQGSTRLIYMARTLFLTADSLLSTTLDVWDSTLGNPEKQARLTGAISGAKAGVQQFDRNLGDWRDSLGHLQSEVRSLHGQFDKLSKDLGPELDSSVKGVHALGGEFTTLQLRFDSLSTTASSLNQKLAESHGSAGLLIHDSIFQNKVKATIADVEVLIKQIRHQGLEMNVDIF